MHGVIVMTVWRDLGYYMVIFLAGLQTIPKEIYGAAASTAQPLAAVPPYHAAAAQPEHRPRRDHRRDLRPAAVHPGVRDDRVTDEAAGWAARLDDVGRAVHRAAGFRPLEMGYPSAAAMLLFVLIMIVTVVQLRVLQRQFEY